MESQRTFQRKAIEELLQKGHNPAATKSKLANYNLLYITEMIKENADARFLLRVYSMRGDEIFYKHANVMCGDQTFIQTVRDLGTRFRIHKDNHRYIMEYDRDNKDV